jgi:hypothetical protein
MGNRRNLHGEFDATVWAEEWMKTIKLFPDVPYDEGTMIGWFANAIMAGYDRGLAETQRMDGGLPANWFKGEISE